MQINSNEWILRSQNICVKTTLTQHVLHLFSLHSHSLNFSKHYNFKSSYYDILSNLWKEV